MAFRLALEVKDYILETKKIKDPLGYSLAQLIKN